MATKNLTTVAFWLSVLSVFVQLNNVNAKECGTMDIRYDRKRLLELTNCTAILGSLSIVLLDDTENMDEINQYSFPQLKEITGYLLFFYVKGLSSTGSLFPNLTVIRGQQLILSYSLMIFELPHLTDISLHSLILIQRGYVFIERCPGLCYHNTIDWEAITFEIEEDLGAGKGNIIQKKVQNKCPTRESCRSCTDQYCWSSKNCQKYNIVVKKCHKLCVGGCVNGTAAGCTVCAGLKMNGRCVEKCPSNLYILPQKMHCVPAQSCIDHELIPFEGECIKHCPTGYSNHEPDTKDINYFKCFKCNKKCPQDCSGGIIRGAAELEYFRGCNIVRGSLYIKLGLNMTDIRDKLEQTLGSIEEIHGSLRIHRSFILTSLWFFRSLNLINSTVTDQNDTNPHPIEIAENDNLQTLFDWKEKLYFKIIGGGMSFHFNSKLCMEEIHKFQEIADYDNKHDSIGYDTNGYDEVCHATGITTFEVVDSYNSVRIYWNITDFGENKTLIGYFVYYLEAPSRDVTYFSGLDACSSKKFRGSSFNYTGTMITKVEDRDSWQSIFVPFESLQIEEGYYEMTLRNLKQYTRYAYYIRTQISLKHMDQLLNVTQGQSQLKYFSTLPDRPKPPIVRTRDKTNTTLTLEWNPSTPENELVQKYFIDVYVQADDVEEIDKRDYCQNPRKKSVESVNFTQTPEVICCSDQRAYLEFFRRNGSQTCGKHDPTCQLTYEYVLFHRQVENTLSMVDLLKSPSERYQFQPESYESPKHYRGGAEPINRKPKHSKHYLHSHIIEGKHNESVDVLNLRPFQMYMFYVYACNNISHCSDYFLHFDRTESSIYADIVGLAMMADERRPGIVSLSIRPPSEPNGVTVAYHIENFDLTRDISNHTCVTRKNMAMMNYTYRFENLLQGTHSFRVRAISIGGVGLFTDFLVVEVDPLSADTTNFIWGIALTFMVIFLIIALSISYQKYKECRYYHVRDEVYLLGERSDSQHSLIQQPPSASEICPVEPVQLLPRRVNRSRMPSIPRRDLPIRGSTKSPLRALPEPPEGIQMVVFKSNISTSTQSLDDRPSTLTASSSTSSIHPEISPPHNQSNLSVTSRILRSLQQFSPRRYRSPPQIDMGESEGISLQDELISPSPEPPVRRYLDYAEVSLLP